MHLGLCCVCVIAGAQCAHAAVGVIGSYKSGNEALFRQWERHGQPKIALKIKDDQEMVSSAAEAPSLQCWFLRIGGGGGVGEGGEVVVGGGGSESAAVHGQLHPHAFKEKYRVTRHERLMLNTASCTEVSSSIDQ
jgi:hypothetical protein